MRTRISRRGLVSAGLVTAGALANGWWAWPDSARAAASGEPGGGTHPAAPANRVSEKDSLAVALNYVSDATRADRKASPAWQPGASCSTCSWYQGKPADAGGGPCTFFPGKLVDAHGWCKMWNKKQ